MMNLTMSEWADKYRIISPGNAVPGKWKTSRTPYLREILDCISDPTIHEVVFQASVQVGKTETCQNTIGYYIHQDPCPILYVGDTLEKTQDFSKTKLASMIRDTPVLNRLVRDPKSRDGDNTIDRKSFTGGTLWLVGSNSPAGLSSRNVRVALLDEVDSYTDTSEGDPVMLAEARTTTFPFDYKLVKVSSPRHKRTSRIEPAYLRSDQRKYYVPCPQCGEFQILKWAQVKFDKEHPDDAFYACAVNGCAIEHDEKTGMLAKGVWRAEKPFAGVAGFWINALYSPWRSWGYYARQWLKAQGNPGALMVFINTVLAETWEDESEIVDRADVSNRGEDYGAEVPDGVLIITAGVDVQKDRIEVEIVGWGLDDESWSLDYHVLYGDPSGKKIWDELKDYLLKPYSFADGRTIYVTAAGLDTGGHFTQQTYAFCKSNAGRRWFAVKGSSSVDAPLVTRRPRQGLMRVKLFMVGTNAAKDTIDARLRIPEPGPGYCHFPNGRDEDYFTQLVAEVPRLKFVNGQTKRVWVKPKADTRNEALDCRVYAMAALAILRPDLTRMHESHAAAAKEDDPAERTSSPQEASVPARRAPSAPTVVDELPTPRRRRRAFVGAGSNWSFK